MDENVFKLLDDLARKLDHLGWIRDHPAEHVTKHIAELRYKINYDTEQLLGNTLAGHFEQALTKWNDKRDQFERILERFQDLLLRRIPKASAGAAEASLRKRLEQFIESASELDKLEDVYLRLALDIIDETNRLEERLFNGQQIVYVESADSDWLGSLVVFGQDFLNRQEIACLSKCKCYTKLQHIEENLVNALNSCLLVPLRRPFILTKSHLVLSSLASFVANEMKLKSSFYFVGRSREEYAGFWAEGMCVEKTFVSSRLPVKTNELSLDLFDGLGTSTVNLFEFYSSNECQLRLSNYRMCSLNAVLPMPLDRLVELSLTNVRLESFRPTSLAKCVNLKKLILLVSFTKDAETTLKYLRALKELEELRLTLTGSQASELNVLAGLENLEVLELRGFPQNCGLIKMSTAALEPVCARLKWLKLSCLEIDSVDEILLSGLKRLESLELTSNLIGTIDENVFRSCGPRLGNVRFKGNDVGDFKIGAFSKKLRVVGLELTDTGIRTLSKTSFQGLDNLHSLSLSRNSIRHLPRGVLDQIDLKNLTLDENPIENIEPNAFPSVLQSLSLVGCRLASIGSNTFPRSLTTLKLSNNRIEGKLDLNCFSGLKLLEELDLSSNQITELNERAQYRLLAKLGRLYLNNNRLTNVPKRAFDESLELSLLDLSGNQLQSLDADFFEPFKRLSRLDLSRNQLTMVITDATFASCRNKLLELKLQGNKSMLMADGVLGKLTELRHVECDLGYDFTGWPSLSTLRIRESSPALLRASFELQTSLYCSLARLSLVGCSIRTLGRDSAAETTDPGVFCLSWLPGQCGCQLVELDLSANLIETLDDPEVFAGLPKLSSINLSQNRLRHIDRRVFAQVPELQIVDLSRNSLSRVDLGLFRTLKDLTRIDLSGNGISFLDVAQLLRVQPRLESLSLDDNSLDNRSLAAIPVGHLKALSLANNRIESMDFMRDLCRLEQLDLSNNLIESVESGVLNGLGLLRHLSLSGNLIRSLRDETFLHLREKIELVDLSRNPLALDSVLRELI